MIGAFRKKSDLPEYLSHYGMHRAPFSSAIEDDMYYSDPARQQRLDVLLHLTQNSNELLVVIGEEGMGKTTFLNQFVKHTPDHWKVCVIEGHKMMTEEQFLERVYQGFSIAHASIHKGAMLSNLRKRLENMLEDAIPIILVIDDAQLFPTRILSLILEIASVRNTKTGGSVRVLLASEPQIKIILAEPALDNTHDLIVRKIDLPALDETSTGNYLHHRLTQAGMMVEQFLTKPTISKIFKSSDGVPKKINEAADKLLFDTTPIIRRNSNIQSAQKSPTLKLIVISLLIAAIAGIAAYLYSVQFKDGDGNKKEKQSETTTTLKLPPIGALENPSGNSASNKTSNESVDPMEALKEELARDTESRKVTPPTVTEPESNQPEKSSAIFADQGTKTEPVAKRENDTQAIMVTDTTDSTTTNTSETQATMVTDTTDNTTTNTSETQETMVKPVPATTNEITITVENSSSDLKDNNWVLEQNPKLYTLQLVAGLQKQTIHNFIKKYQLKNNLIYFRSKRNEKIWYNLAYGLYPDRKSANQAIKNLPAVLANEKPWIRQIDAIQSEIRKLNQP